MTIGQLTREAQNHELLMPNILAAVDPDRSQFEGLEYVLVVYIAVLPFLMISAGGVKSLAGLGLLILDCFLAGMVGRLILRLQRRIGIPEILIGFGTIVVVPLFLVVFHALLVWSIYKLNGWIR